MASSFNGNSPPGVVKPSMHKRGINFPRSRSSGASGSTIRSATRTPGSPTKTRSVRNGQLDAYPTEPGSSPTAVMHTVVRSRKEALRANATPSRLRKSHTQDEVFDKEARKVSTELEKFCEEAFFRTSVGSSSRNSTTSHAAHDTPPSSVSNRGSGKLTASLQPADPEKVLNAVPQRVLPSDNPNAIIQQELAETRKRLAARYAQDESAQDTTYRDVMSHLDALLREGSASPTGFDIKRTASGYASRATNLPVISEEDRSAEAEGKHHKPHRSDSASTTRPFVKSEPMLLDKSPSRNISPPPQIAPLVIRKISGSSTNSQPRTDELLSPRNFGGSATRLARKFSPASLAGPTPSGSLGRIIESYEAEERACESPDSDRPIKKGNWFTRKFQSTEPEEIRKNKKFNIYEDNAKASRSDDWTLKALQISELQETESGSREKSSVATGLAGKRPGFLKFLTRKRMKKPVTISNPMVYAGESFESPWLRSTADSQSEDADEASMASTPQISIADRGTDTFRRQNHTLDQSAQNDPDSLGVQRNWLARFLNIKPATRILCFCTGRGRARQEIVRLLRSWYRYGIQDVLVDRARNLVYGRLDAVNHLGIREVNFVVEIYVILKEGRRAGLSVARFTQQKGAASSFRRVTDAVEGMLRSRGVLVERGEAWREMEAVLMSGCA